MKGIITPYLYCIYIYIYIYIRDPIKPLRIMICGSNQQMGDEVLNKATTEKNNSKAKPILPGSYQKKVYCYWENKDFEGESVKDLNNYLNFSTLSN